MANGDPVIDHELFPDVVEHNTQDITLPPVLPNDATMSTGNLICKNNYYEL